MAEGTSPNPYEAPQAPLDAVVGVRSGRRDDLRKIAFDQRAIVTCLLIYLIGVVVNVVGGGPSRLPEGVAYLIGAVLLVNAVVGAVFVVLLAVRVYGVAVGILLAVFTLVPCVGLLILLAVNAKATKVLRANGYRVGLFGADMRQFPPEG